MNPRFTSRGSAYVRTVQGLEQVGGSGDPDHAADRARATQLYGSANWSKGGGSILLNVADLLEKLHPGHGARHDKSGHAAAV